MGLLGRVLGPGRPFKDGDADLGVRSGPESAYERESKAGLTDYLGPRAAVAAFEASKTAVKLEMPGWAAYYSLSALMSGCPTTLGPADFLWALQTFNENYALATGRLFPINTGGLLEWLVNRETGLSGYSPNGPGACYEHNPLYWEQVRCVAESFLRDVAEMGAKYGDAEAHVRIAEQLLS